MNNVKKAIIMAAGKGQRLLPLTDTIPKPLIEVNGKRMIDGIIEALKMRGVSNIVVVVGYLHEKFDYLKEKYGIKLILNPDYTVANNISSLYYARDELESCVILDGDQIFNDITVIKKHFRHSGYTCWYTRKFSNEWIMNLSSIGSVVSCSRTGGSNGWELKSLSYWSEEDAKKLAQRVKSEYESGNTQVYWDDIAMFLHKSEFELYAHKIPLNAITEIDSIDELISVDKKYAKVKESL